jgi:protein gp37
MAETSIEWTDVTWNPIRGCSRVSTGCENCYAERVAARFSKKGQPYHGLATFNGAGMPRWTGHVQTVFEKLHDPVQRWHKPRRVFVNSMSDLFHESLMNETIAEVFHTMLLARQHTFQILTKRAERMRDWFDWLKADLERGFAPSGLRPILGPLPNVWLGVSCENQDTANERTPLLLQCPAAVHFISAEPLLENIELDDDWMEPHCPSCGSRPVCHDTRCPGVGTSAPTLDWVIIGGESGPSARDCNIAWIENLHTQCLVHGVPAFVKQLGTKCYRSGTRLRMGSKGQNYGDWPTHLQDRRMPRSRKAAA